MVINATQKPTAYMTARSPEETRNPMAEKDLESKQRLRLQRFGMSVATYAIMGSAAVLVTRMGLGEMSRAQWTICILVGLAGNICFFLLFVTGRNLRFKDPSLTWAQIFYSALWGMVILYALPGARPIILMFYVPAFSFGMLRLTRRQYLGLVGSVLGLYAVLLVFEFLQGRQGFRWEYELFLFALFGILLTWFSFFGGFVSHIRHRLNIQRREIQKAHEVIQIEVDERKRAQEEKDRLIVELRAALDKVKTLGGLLPICASCKKIRDDAGYWRQIESYIHDHSEAKFSHGICPECAKKLYPDLDIHKKA